MSPIKTLPSVPLVSPELPKIVDVIPLDSLGWVTELVTVALHSATFPIKLVTELVTRDASS
jgi:hypothetical protein